LGFEAADAVVVGSIQTFHVAGLKRWPATHFKSIITDEAQPLCGRDLSKNTGTFHSSENFGHHGPELAEFEPVVPWHFESLSERQADGLRSFGIDPTSVRNRVHGSLILKHLYARRQAGLETYRQLRLLVRFGYKNPLDATFAEASTFLDRYFRRRTRFRYPKTAAST
jgi:hypothetical protein